MIAALVAVLSLTGSYRLPATAEPVPLQVEAHGTYAYVSLGPGHAGRQRVAYHGGSFTLPGGVSFSHGVVRQGALRGTYTLEHGTSRVLPALGLYRRTDGKAVAIVKAEGLPTWLVELPSGDVHGLDASLSSAGGVLGATAGGGAVAVTPVAVTWRGARYARVPLRQREVRVGKIAATLTLPPGRGPFPAVVMTHGSGPHARDEFQVFSAWCELLGVAVIADDKRGIGQSQGRYPGEAATSPTVDVLARDAQAEARYLSRLPEIDAKRIGLLGDSQAGWVIALAAARERLFHWAVPLVGPTVSVDESDTWGRLAGQGQAPPSGTREAMLAAAHAAKGGFDPAPYLRKLTIPVHWVFGDDDRNVPTELCIKVIRGMKQGHNFTWDVVHSTHTLLELPSGMNSDIPRSRGFARGLFRSVGAFLRRVGVAASGRR